MLNVETKFGSIRLSQNVINKIVAESMKNCKDRAEIMNYKGKYKNVVPGIASKINLYDEEYGGISFMETDDGLDIKVYIVVKFGVSIKKITSEIIDNIYINAEKVLGETPNKVTIVVTGTISKNIAKRHIEVSR